MNRVEYLARLFPGGIPKLWCPLLAHFSAPARPDAERIHRHMREISGSVGGLLVPGSTGEGWDMSADDAEGVLTIVLERTKELGQHLLIGALAPTAEETVSSINQFQALVKERSSKDDPVDRLADLGIAGFTICPPTGSSLSQDELSEAIEHVLALGLPTALYQLPQVTQNEIAADRVAALAAAYPNLILFKDTSGNDRVATAASSHPALDELFFVRGAEGGYASWPKAAGGPYDGLLLSTANSFSAELGQILSLLADDRHAEAQAISARIERCVDTLFPPAGDVPAGNAFAVANKVFDHIRAYGSMAAERPAPILYGGTPIPESLIELGIETVRANGFTVDHGYLQE